MAAILFTARTAPGGGAPSPTLTVGAMAMRTKSNRDLRPELIWRGLLEGAHEASRGSVAGHGEGGPAKSSSGGASALHTRRTRLLYSSSTSVMNRRAWCRLCRKQRASSEGLHRVFQEEARFPAGCPVEGHLNRSSMASQSMWRLQSMPLIRNSEPCRPEWR